MKTILIHTNDRLKADSLEKIMRADGFPIVGKSTNPETISMRRPDVVVTDEIIDTSSFSAVRFILLLPAFDSPMIIEALKANYWGFVMSADGLQGLYDCIRTVQDGQKYFSVSVLENLSRVGLEVPNEKVTNALARLSDREKQILKLISKGTPGHDIADQLFISYRTLANHKNNITEKLQLDSARNLTAFAISVSSYL